jgi:hypothetical protein
MVWNAATITAIAGLVTAIGSVIGLLMHNKKHTAAAKQLRRYTDGQPGSRR